MKKFIEQFALPFLLFVLMIGIFTPSISKLTHLNPISIVVIAIGVAVTITAFSKKTSTSIARHGLEVEIWANYIIERLWKDNTFLQRAFSDDDKVLAGKIVHIPQPGAKPTVVKNRNVYPATAVRRADTDIMYALDEFTTDPTHIPDAEKVELSYNKIDSVYGDHAGQIAEDVAGTAITTWLNAIPAPQILRTTGANTTEILTGATGTRKVLVHTDIRRMQKLFNKQNIPTTERSALLSADMADQLVESLSNTQYRDFSAYMDAKEGVIGRLYGFDILTRSEVASATTGLAINPYGAAIAATDNDVAMFWQKNAVARAIGEVKFFENLDRAEYYGDVYSALLRFGGRRRRADNMGVGALIQTT